MSGGGPSTEEQAKSGLGIDAQLEAVHRAISDRGWELAGTVVDAGVSGTVPPDHREALGPVPGGPRLRLSRRAGGRPPRPDHPEPVLVRRAGGAVTP